MMFGGVHIEKYRIEVHTAADASASSDNGALASVVISGSRRAFFFLLLLPRHLGARRRRAPRPRADPKGAWKTRPTRDLSDADATLRTRSSALGARRRHAPKRLLKIDRRSGQRSEVLRLERPTDGLKQMADDGPADAQSPLLMTCA